MNWEHHKSLSCMWKRLFCQLMILVKVITLYYVNNQITLNGLRPWTNIALLLYMFHIEQTGNKRLQYKRNVIEDIIHSNENDSVSVLFRKFRGCCGLFDMEGYSQYAYIDEIKTYLHSLWHRLENSPEACCLSVSKVRTRQRLFF